jgi:Lrp/AsnC family leucine-responsive transcriptional regulator
VNRLKEQGYIRETVALLDPARLNLAVEAHVTVAIKDHSTDTEQRFREHIEALEEVISCDYVAGEADYILKVVTENLASYQHFLSQKLLQGGYIQSVRSSIILKPMKRTTALPLDFA